MNRNLCGAAFFLGLIAVCWVGVGYVGSNPLALTMTLMIGATYVIGALELLRFQQTTSTLALALAAIPQNLSNLGDWLDKVHPSLQNPVRLRIEGERIGLPGPTVTPYLVGLLVMLGMLGTFLGMVVTLNGTVIALESTTDLQAMRSSLAAPVKGLGLAFGTSVAGVAASAMLGLISALCRRERVQAGQLLDSKIATVLRGFSLSHQRQETFKALQFQAQALPDVVDKLQAMMAQMERQSQQLNERLLANQEGFYRDVKGVYSELACAVDKSLKESLTESARVAGETIQPVVEATLTGIARNATVLHEGMADTIKLQLDGLSARFDSTVTTVSDTWTAALAKHERSSEDLTSGMQKSLEAFTETFEQRSASLLATVGEAHSALQADLALRDQQRLAALTQALESMAASLQREWQQAGVQALAQQEQMCKTLDHTTRDFAAQAQAQANNTINEIARLMQTAAEAPRAAAEVIGQLRQELSNSIARDNELLEERSRVLETLSALLDTINHASTEQREAIDSLVASSAALLDRVGGQFTEKLEAESAKITGVAAQITSSAVEVSSLGEAFGLAVQLFGESNEKLIANLQRVEGSLDKSMLRTDEQFAYYVAQARELIDLSIMSQKQVVEDLQRLSGKPALLDGEVC
jgi:hypothetical protein